MSWYYYPRSTPREAKGGMRLRTGKETARSWWGKKWVEALESFGWHTRLTRGRGYARSGQVVSIEIKPGEILARVQGSKPKPYEVRIGLRRIPRKDWTRLAEKLARKALFSAKLLAGEMPEGLDEAFRKGGVALFPKTKKDLETECACPDWENPCKHIAAAYYILAQELDQDPFLLLRIRGIEKEDFLAQVRAFRRKGSSIPNEPDAWRPGPASPSAPKAGGGMKKELKGETVGLDRLADFYRLAQELPTDWGPRHDRIAQAPPPGSLVREMGAPPFWRGETPFEETILRVFQAVRARAAGLAGVDLRAQAPAPRGRGLGAGSFKLNRPKQ